MIFGLCNAAQTFQRLINEVLRGVYCAFPYIDDICVASSTLEQHRRDIAEVLRRLRENHLAINLKKCEFGQRQIHFLGHLVNSEGIFPLPEKVAVIKDYPKPQVAQELKRFINMINFYRKFLPHAISYQMILQQLIEGNVKNDRTPVSWTSDAEAAFIKCKTELANAALLVHPARDAELAIYADASDTAVGAALHQCVNGTLEPLSFYSKKLTPAQQNYSTYDRELAAIYQAITYFQYMIDGRRCYVVTDHRPLTFAFKQRPPKLEKTPPRRIRQLDFISQFTTDIRHTPGHENSVADALSRISSVSAIDYEKISAAQEVDIELQQMLNQPGINSLNLKEFPLLNSKRQLVCDVSSSVVRPYIPMQFRQQVLGAVHNLLHSGIRATTKLATSRFCWPGIRKAAANFVRNCIDCQRSKVQRHTRTTPGRYEPPKDRFSHINIDIVGPFPLCEGQRYCLTIIDRFTREAVPMADMSADTIVKALLTHWISRFGVPAKITSDRGRQLESMVFAGLVKTIGATHLRTTPYQPQSNGIMKDDTAHSKLLSCATILLDGYTICPQFCLVFE